MQGGLTSLKKCLIFVLQPPVKSIRVEDVFAAIEADIIIMKIDIEGYECKV